MRNLLKLAASFSLITAATACSSGPGELKDPPILKITSPQRSLVQNGAGMIEVTGEVTPNAGGAPVAKVIVNGVEAYVGEGGVFSAQIQVQPGATLITTEATDTAGGKASDTRAVHAGELRGPGAMIDEAITIGLSDEAMHAMGKAAGNTMKSIDMAPIFAPLNPMVKAGLDNGQEDCLYGKVSVNDFNMSDAIIDMEPVDGGIAFSMELKSVKIPMHARYGAACLDGDTDIEVSATSVKVEGVMGMTVSGNSFVASLKEKNVSLTGFKLNASGVPGSVLDILHLDSAISWVIEKGAERFMAPMVEQAFAGVAGTKTLDVMGKKLNMAVVPADVFFDPAAAHIVLSSRMGLQGTEGSKGFIYTPNTMTDLNPRDGFKFGLADDAANQLLASVTAAGMLNLSQPAPGGSFDTANITATLPPMISADPKDGRLKVVAGDLIMTFTSLGKPVGRAALNVMVDLKVTGVGANAKVELGKPVIHVTTIADEIANDTGFLDEDLAKVTEMAVKHQVEVIEQMLSGVTLPSFQGVSMSNLSVAGDSGYLVISGSLR
jgi:hypothetical protein